MDFDIEMGDAVDAYPGEADPYTTGAETAVNDAPQEDILDIDQEPGEIEEDPVAGTGSVVASAVTGTSGNPDDTTLIPTKVHVRGLDTFNPADIKAYVAEHCAAAVGSFDRIEWIDDASANLLFPSAATAAAALVALAALPIDDPAQLPLLEMLPAKPYSAKPDAVPALQVRFAVASDKKQVGAAARSRFYLLHPEYDPEERRRRRGGGGGYRDRGGGDRDRDHRSRYRSDRRRDDRYDDRDDREGDIRRNAFDVNLYDDDDSALATRTTTRRGRRSRSRSRSSWSSRSSRSQSRRRNYRSRSDRNRDKELFPGGGASKARELFPSDGAASHSKNNSKELFPTKELFPDKMGERLANTTASRSRGSGRGSPRRRDNRSVSPQRANDDHDYDGRLADERAEAAAAAAARNRDKARAIKNELSRNGSARELFPDGLAKVDLFGSSSGLTARLSDTDDRSDENNGSTFSIRGLASSGAAAGGSNGFSIKGAATARELFPNKLNSPGNDSNNSKRNRNAGKEIFSDKLENRIRPRRRAEDMFH